MPPLDGAGLLHVLFLGWTPASQVSEQASQSDQIDHPPFTGGHTMSPQVTEAVSLSRPSQLWPPYSGVGLLHNLVCDLEPPPQVTEQALHKPHVDQLPSIAWRKKYKLDNFNYLGYNCLRGQGIKWHICVSSGCPKQILPPYRGEGSVQDLELLCVPLLQLWEHWAHWVQILQYPCPYGWKMNNNLLSCNIVIIY